VVLELAELRRNAAPALSQPCSIDFYGSGRAGAAGAAVEWMGLVSNMSGAGYLAGVPGRRYELKPTGGPSPRRHALWPSLRRSRIAAVAGTDLLAVLSSLLGSELRDVGALQVSAGAI
jgi:hypothetical protein